MNTNLPDFELVKLSPNEEKMAIHLLSGYTKACIIQMLTPFVDLIKRFRFVYATPTGPQPIDFSNVSKNFNSMLKDPLVRLAAIFINEVNLRRFVGIMAEKDVELFRSVLCNVYLHEKKVRAKMACRQPGVRLMFGAFVEMSFAYDDGFWEHEKYLSLPRELRHIFWQAFYADYAEPRLADSLPDGEQLHTYTNEAMVFTTVNTLRTLFDCRTLPHDLRKVPVAILNKVIKSVSVPEFFPEPDKPKKPKPGPAFSMMVNVFTMSMMAMDTNDVADTVQLVKQLVEHFPAYSYMHPMLLPHVRGWRTPYLWSNAISLLSTALLEELKRGGDKWQRVDDMIIRVRMARLGNDDAFRLAQAEDFDRMKVNNAVTKKRIVRGELVEQISVPMVQSLLATMSLFGVVEMAYADPQAGDVWVLSRLSHVRLTAFGRYVVGLTDSYESQVGASPDMHFEVDEQRLFVRMPSPQNPYGQIVRQMAHEVSPTLFVVNEKTFLAGCDEREDVELRIKQFKQYVCAQPPQIWTDFFNRMLAGCHPIREDGDYYTVLVVPANDTRLQHIIATDPVIRKLVLRAEGFRLLVRPHQLKQLDDALREHGYLL